MTTTTKSQEHSPRQINSQYTVTCNTMVRNCKREVLTSPLACNSVSMADSSSAVRDFKMKTQQTFARSTTFPSPKDLRSLHCAHCHVTLP